jgi:exodeoxyribonuclease-5
LRLETTLDRLDQLADGRLLVVDYKTGAQVATANWASERLLEPQLPLYAAVVQHPQGPVGGVAFAHVRLREPKGHGLAADQTVLPGLPHLEQPRLRARYQAQGLTQWQQVLWHWQDRLQALAQEVLAGEAAVRVKDEDDLRHCPVLPLLRLDERRRQWEDQRGA